ncbi:MAG TPA: HyaD/HybD family hydrogenase maturation endopeptidase [Vicinamibacterales bacterium]|nr:HyaD/HybD family hydrogenase maturation endopeptidase [Vicinamibacterales bacterium]
MTKVLGLGNVLMGDDGFGPAVVRAFDAMYEAGPDVEVIDLGTPGLDLMPWLADVDSVIIVDTVKSDLPPGSMRFYDKRDLLGHVPSLRTGPHDPGLSETLRTLEFAGRAPQRVALIGVVPERVAMGLELTPVARAAVPCAVEVITAVLRQFGIAVLRRDAPAPPVPWWSTSATPSVRS